MLVTGLLIVIGYLMRFLLRPVIVVGKPESTVVDQLFFCASTRTFALVSLKPFCDSDASLANHAVLRDYGQRHPG